MKPSHPKVPKVCALSDPARDLSPHVCQSVGDVLARVGDKWSLLVIYMLSNGSMRFSELKRSLASISQKVLTTTLRGLERDGYITRQVTPSIPPRVDYALTALGHDALSPVIALASWAISRAADVEKARRAFDKKSQASR